MKVEIRFRNVESSPAVVEYAERRAHQHLSRFGREVATVMLRFSDLNGPRGGCDKRCQVTVTGPRVGTVNLSETREDIFASIDLILDRTAHAVGRGLERTRAPQARF